MAGRDREPHQPEPWSQEGRYILDAGQWTLASTKFPADARRIVAAVNAVRGIPTDALESWVINVIGDPGGRRGKERRETQPEIQIWAGAPLPPAPSDESKGQTGS